MKAIGYKAYASLNSLFKLFPYKKKKAVFFMHHDCHFQGNIRFIYDEFAKKHPDYKLKVYNKKDLNFGRFWFSLNKDLASSGYIFLNDNFLPLGYMNLRDETTLVQLWHGAGSYKKFGLDTEENETVRKLTQTIGDRIDYMPVTSDTARSVFAKALNVPLMRVRNVGLPLMDFYFDEAAKKRSAEDFYNKYPELRGKKLILYTPTFRANEKDNNNIFKALNAPALLKELNGEYVLLLRFHPQKPPSLPTALPEGVINVSSYDNVRDLYVVSDMLITDYSCTAVEYSLLDKPIIFYTYDREKYDRGAYLDFDDFPVKTSSDITELLEAIRTPERQMLNTRFFKDFNFSCELKPGFSERILDDILKIKE